MSSSLARNETQSALLPAITAEQVVAGISRAVAYHPEQDRPLNEIADHADTIRAQAPLTLQDVAEAASKHLGDLAYDHAIETRCALTADVVADYNPEEAEGIESPNHFAKRMGLDGSFRPWLRDAQRDSIEASTKRLRETAQSVDVTPADGTIPEPHELHDDANTFMQTIVERVTLGVQRFQEVSTSTPDLIALKSSTLGRHKIERRRLNIEHNSKSVEQRREELKALSAVGASLFNYIQRKKLTVQHIAVTHMPRIKDMIDTDLSAKFAGLTEKELAALRKDLEAAYQKAVEAKELHDEAQSRRGVARK